MPFFLDPEQLDLDELDAIVERAGRFIGVGDYRPMYGRFIAEVDKV